MNSIEERIHANRYYISFVSFAIFLSIVYVSVGGYSMHGNPSEDDIFRLGGVSIENPIHHYRSNWIPRSHGFPASLRNKTHFDNDLMGDDRVFISEKERNKNHFYFENIIRGNDNGIGC